MRKEKWNPADWQGRTQKQVETTNTILAYTFVGLIIAVCCAFISIVL